MDDVDVKNRVIQALKENAESEKASDFKEQAAEPVTLIPENTGLSPGLIAGAAAGAIIGLILLYAYVLHPGAGDRGKIIQPAAGSETGSRVKVTARTWDIEPGEYVWLVVDKPEMGVCWPKFHVSEVNIHFKIAIYEGGPDGPYSLSLYVVNQDIHDQWTAWQSARKVGGVPMLPKQRLLDTVRLVLKGSGDD